MKPQRTGKIVGIMARLTIATLCVATMLLAACGTKGPWHGNTEPPGAPNAVTANVGDGAVSLGWDAPTTGSGPFTYAVAISPAANTSTTIGNNATTTRIIRGLANNTTYTFSVTATNAAGTSAATTVTATPSAAVGANFTPILVQGDNSPSGIFDPSLLRLANNEIWMTYSSVNYYTASGHLTQDVSTKLARSQDGGQSFTYIRTLGAAGNGLIAPQGNVTITDTTNTICNNPTCSGRWVYEVPFLVDDASDPDPNRRFKLFAHKYFYIRHTRPQPSIPSAPSSCGPRQHQPAPGQPSSRYWAGILHPQHSHRNKISTPLARYRIA